MPSHEPIKCQCCTHIETSQLIGTANQLTGFYMRALVFNELISIHELSHLFSRKFSPENRT